MALPPTAADLATFMHLSAGHAADVDALLDEVLSAAVEWAVSKVGPLGLATQTVTAYPSGRSLVLPVTHLSEVVAVTDPAGAAVPLSTVQVNLLSGIVTVPYSRKGQWTVQVTTEQQSASIGLAIKIVAKHLYEVHRARGAGARAAAYAAPPDEGVPGRGFAIPARAADLIAPFRLPTVA